jgi:glutamate/tyrosine decarboxylase-like PLP-dependent enzyme
MEQSQNRVTPLNIPQDDFQKLGHDLVDKLADLFDSLGDMKVKPDEGVREIRHVLGVEGIPEQGKPPAEIINRAFDLLINHSLFNSHPRFLGYITAPPAPIAVLADLMAAALNPNVGAWQIAPMATEIELQTVRWIAELIGFPSDCGGVLVSGGNMANFVGFLAGRKHQFPGDVRQQGTSACEGKPYVYCSAATHTWVQKAADLFGLGTEAIRWIETDSHQRMDLKTLEERIKDDLANGDIPLMVIGTAGSVSTGAIDPLGKLAGLCKQYNLWFHVDGAYGGFAACLPDAPKDLRGLSLADSVAIDPHKWLYQPLEAGCALVRDPKIQVETFSYHPDYYRWEDVIKEEIPTNLVDYSPQNSRGFRALKVWMSLQQAGRSGYQEMIGEDIQLAQHLYKIAEEHPELQAMSCELSITTFRFIPSALDLEDEGNHELLNELNGELLTTLQRNGEMFVSNAIVDDHFLLRACVVNFHTTINDIEALPEIIVRTGREVYDRMNTAG